MCVSQIFKCEAKSEVISMWVPTFTISIYMQYTLKVSTLMDI